MKAVIRRLRRFEDRFGPAVETEFSRCLHECIEAARRRLQEAEERGEYQAPESGPHDEFHRRRLMEAPALRV